MWTCLTVLFCTLHESLANLSSLRPLTPHVSGLCRSCLSFIRMPLVSNDFDLLTTKTLSQLQELRFWFK